MLRFSDLERANTRDFPEDADTATPAIGAHGIVCRSSPSGAPNVVWPDRVGTRAYALLLMRC